MDIKDKEWKRAWFDKNINFYLERLNNFKGNEEAQIALLWNFLKYSSESSYAKGRNSGIEYAIKKYVQEKGELTK